MKSTPDLSDEYPETLALQPILTNYGGKISFWGSIETLQCPDDNSLIKEQLNTEGNGKVLIVDAGGVNTVALLGDLIAEAGEKNNWSGIVINGYIRDVDIIRTLDIGVQALGTYPVKSQKRGLGKLGIAISFGGLTFKPGQYVYADNNGLLLSEIELNSP
ncbi:MAG TPA: ribonuclease E activity regulator RraA [Gammaproteobacteria bacterium]|nr:ribonuclease E activity regulator RraA [Gammaproteobacteria bacterium]